MEKADGVARGIQPPVTTGAEQCPLEGKIRDKETREPPHVTIIRRTDAWRLNLRTGEFMDAVPDPARVPREVVAFITQESTWQQLCRQWDQMYPDNPVNEEDAS